MLVSVALYLGGVIIKVGWYYLFLCIQECITAVWDLLVFNRGKESVRKAR